MVPSWTTSDLNYNEEQTKPPFPLVKNTMKIDSILESTEAYPKRAVSLLSW